MKVYCFEFLNLLFPKEIIGNNLIDVMLTLENPNYSKTLLGIDLLKS